MTTVKLDGKTIEIADGLDVRFDGDKIFVSPKEPAFQIYPTYPVSIPAWPYPSGPVWISPSFTCGGIATGTITWGSNAGTDGKSN